MYYSVRSCRIGSGAVVGALSSLPCPPCLAQPITSDDSRFDAHTGAETAAKVLTFSSSVVDQANIGGQVRARRQGRTMHPQHNSKKLLHETLSKVYVMFQGVLQKLSLFPVDAGAFHGGAGGQVAMPFIHVWYAYDLHRVQHHRERVQPQKGSVTWPTATKKIIFRSTYQCPGKLTRSLSQWVGRL